MRVPITEIGKTKVVRRVAFGEIFDGKRCYFTPLNITKRWNGMYWETISKELAE